MRLQSLFASTALLLSCLPAALGEGLADSLSILPSCAVDCLKSSIEASSCELTDNTCLCTNDELQTAIEVCILKSCTMKEALFTKNVTYTGCDMPIRNKSQEVKDVSAVLGIITGVFVASRLIFKGWVAKMGLTADDWSILLAVVAGAPSTALSIHGTAANGLGQDVWTLPYETITRFGMYFYVMEILYFINVTLLKVSILFFYLRIFPAIGIRRILWATMAFNILLGLVFSITATFQCQPISYFWTKWDGEQTGKCVNVNAIAWANAIISIVLDVWMLGIPLSQLPKIKLHWKRKLGVGLMFFVGTFVTIVSILRLRSLVTFANSHNPTWDNTSVTLWSVIEINVGIICACMPTLRIALARAFSIFNESTINTGYGAGYRNQPSASGKMGNSRAGAVASGLPVHRSANAEGIMYKKTFEVQYSDESALVQMRDLSSARATSDASSGKS